jgi:hypothetical protein
VTRGRGLRSWLGYGVSGMAVAAAVAHVIWPAAKIDANTVLLLAIALVPWLGILLESLELPGGLKLKYRALEERVDKSVHDVVESKSNAADAISVANVALGATRAGRGDSTSSPDPESDQLGQLITKMRALRTLPSSNSLTDVMDQLFGEMTVVARQAAGFSVTTALQDEDPEVRLAAYANLYGDPDPGQIGAVVDNILNETTKFNQYWAIKTLRVLMSDVDAMTVPRNIEGKLQGLIDALPVDAIRSRELSLLLKEMQSRS